MFLNHGFDMADGSGAFLQYCALTPLLNAHFAVPTTPCCPGRTMVGTSVSGRTWEIQGTGHGEHMEQVTGDTEDAGHRYGQEGDSRGRQTRTFVPGDGA